jgi:membrane protease YdiL (CAAX protease family)
LAGTKRALPYWLGYALLWATALAYLAAKGADWTFPVAVLLIFGVGASGLGWLLTRRATPPETPVARPPLELAAVLAYLILYAFLFLGPGLSALRTAIAPGAAQDALVLAAKLIVHVLLPAGLLILLGAKIGPLFESGLGRRTFWRALLVLAPAFLILLAVVSPSLRNIAALHPPLALLLWAAPLSYLWIAAEAGLCEEFLYRAVLQTRIAAALRSPAAAIPVASLIFALAHAPGLYLRGGPGVDGWSADPLQVAAFAIATLSPIGLFFGTLWWRSRSLLLIVLLHGAIDVLPNMPEFLEHFAGLRP